MMHGDPFAGKSDLRAVVGFRFTVYLQTCGVRAATRKRLADAIWSSLWLQGAGWVVAEKREEVRSDLAEDAPGLTRRSRDENGSSRRQSAPHKKDLRQNREVQLKCARLLITHN